MTTSQKRQKRGKAHKLGRSRQRQGTRRTCNKSLQMVRGGNSNNDNNDNNDKNVNMTMTHRRPQLQNSSKNVIKYYLTSHSPFRMDSPLSDWRDGVGLDDRFDKVVFSRNRYAFKYLYLILEPGLTHDGPTCPQMRSLPIKSTIGTVLKTVQEMAIACTCQDLNRHIFFGIRYVDMLREMPVFMVYFDPDNSM